MSCVRLCLAALLSACASPPDPAPLPFDLPPAFVAPVGPAQAASEAWWKDFGDAHLDAFVADALTRNPALAQAVARVRIAQALAQLNRADALPRAGLAVSSTRQRQPLGNGRHATVGSETLGVEVSWEIDLWGRLASLSAAGQADAMAAGEQLRALRQAIAAQMARLYFGVVEARAQVALSERTVASMGEMARQINHRVDAGIASPADGMLANANLASAEAGLAQRREALERLLRQLETLMGDYPKGALPTAADLPPVPLQPAPGLPSELLARRPDVRSAEWALQAAGHRLGAAQRSFLPALVLSGSAGSDLADLFGSGAFAWSVAGRLLQPVYQGGRLRAQVAAAEGQRDLAVQAYADTVLTAFSEVETALAVDAALAQRETAVGNAAAFAEEAARVSFNRYLQGIDPFLNVLEGQQRALDGRSAQIATHRARLDNRIALHLALGGGFDAALPAASPSEGARTHE